MKRKKKKRIIYINNMRKKLTIDPNGKIVFIKGYKIEAFT
jgi:hypothetical protein